MALRAMMDLTRAQDLTRDGERKPGFTQRGSLKSGK
jgi:hypothetical protein